MTRSTPGKNLDLRVGHDGDAGFSVFSTPGGSRCPVGTSYAGDSEDRPAAQRNRPSLRITSISRRQQEKRPNAGIEHGGRAIVPRFVSGRLLIREEGQTLAEYALIFTLVVVARRDGADRLPGQGRTACGAPSTIHFRRSREPSTRRKGAIRAANGGLEGNSRNRVLIERKGHDQEAQFIRIASAHAAERCLASSAMRGRLSPSTH